MYIIYQVAWLGTIFSNTMKIVTAKPVPPLPETTLPAALNSHTPQFPATKLPPINLRERGNPFNPGYPEPNIPPSVLRLIIPRPSVPRIPRPRVPRPRVPHPRVPRPRVTQTTTSVVLVFAKHTQGPIPQYRCELFSASARTNRQSRTDARGRMSSAMCNTIGHPSPADGTKCVHTAGRA